jgi:hypothetical protein
MAINRLRVTWGNFPGAPGVSTHYFSTTVTDFSPVRTFYNAISTLLPANVQLVFPNVIDTINESTGTLTGSFQVTQMAMVTSTQAAAAYSGASGAVVRWNTTGIWHGKRVTGRTYLVPLHGAAFQTDGSLAGTTLTTIGTAANAMCTAFGDTMRVWARPFAGSATREPRNGTTFSALSATVPDLAAVLRSRRV